MVSLLSSSLYSLYNIANTDKGICPITDSHKIVAEQKTIAQFLPRAGNGGIELGSNMP